MNGGISFLGREKGYEDSGEVVDLAVKSFVNTSLGRPGPKKQKSRAARFHTTTTL